MKKFIMILMILCILPIAFAGNTEEIENVLISSQPIEEGTAVSAASNAGVVSSSGGSGGGHSGPQLIHSEVVTAVPTDETATSEVITSSGSTGMIRMDCEMINKELKKDYDEAIKKYEYAKEAGYNDEDMKEIKEHISRIKEKIAYNRDHCWQQQIAVSIKAPRLIQSSCESDIERLNEELDALYKKLEIVKENEDDSEEIEELIKDVKKKLEIRKKECAEGPTVATAPTEWLESTTAPSNIASYYVIEMEKILEKSDSIDQQITELKDLRVKIDELIEELISKKEVIETDEFSGLVEKFKIKPNEITADNVIIVTTDKEVKKTINDKEIKIRPTEHKVIISIGNIEVKADEVELTDKIKVEDVELKVLPDKINEIVKEEIKDARVIKEDGKLIYKVRTEEDRKIIGLFKAKAEKNYQIDASIGSADIIEVDKPWWFAISSEVN